MRNLLLTGFLVPVFLAASQDNSWLTRFESSRGTETPRYEETMDFCRKLDKASEMINLFSMGKSAQGRDIPVLIVDRDGYADPTRIRGAGRLVVLVQACIHPGECEGKDAMLMFLRDIVKPGSSAFFGKNPLPSDPVTLLDKVSILFIPVFNPDGHERFGPYNRINQNGPKEMGWRVTANNLNLNRDHLKAETPEMQAWLIQFNRWMPDFFIDTHTTDGADYQYVLTYQMETNGNMYEGLSGWAKSAFIPSLEERMNAAGFLIFPYVEFRNWTDLKSGLKTGVSPPMLSQVYTSLRNRPGLLIETHMLKPYRDRVASTYHCILFALEILDREAGNLKEFIINADSYAASPAFRANPFPLQYKNDPSDSTMVDFRGVEYETLRNPLTGNTYNRYLEKPVTYRMACFNRNLPEVQVRLPEAYIIPTEWKEVIARLRLHGIRYTLLAKDTLLSVTGWRFSNPKWNVNPYEGRHALVAFDAADVTGERVFPAGSAVVPMDQPSARIIAHLLEPKGNGSLLYWGFFDAIFEQKEYAEEYVLAPLILKMMEDEPGLKQEFEKKKKSDPDFAKNPFLVNNWIFSKTPYFDSRKNLYPVGRIYDGKLVKRLTSPVRQ